jgi:hypothetical protein
MRRSFPELEAAGSTEKSVTSYHLSPVCDRMLLRFKHQYQGTNDSLLIHGRSAGISVQMLDDGEQVVKVEKIKLCKGVIH